MLSRSTALYMYTWHGASYVATVQCLFRLQLAMYMYYLKVRSTVSSCCRMALHY